MGMINGWKNYKKNPIWNLEDSYTENFIVIYNENDSLYYAFFTYGFESYQKIGMACSHTPCGPFINQHHISPIINNSTRLGSIIAPCELTNNKWRLYFNIIINKDVRTINYIESSNLITWSNEYVVNLPKVQGYFAQPYVQIVNDEFIMMVTYVEDNIISVNHYVSNDGLTFTQRFKNPFIKPKKDTKYSEGIASPSFYYEDGIYNIFLEGKENNEDWRLFFASQDKNDIVVYETSLTEKNTANPFITKFNDVYYLYYGKKINHKWSIHVCYNSSSIDSDMCLFSNWESNPNYFNTIWKMSGNDWMKKLGEKFSEEYNGKSLIDIGCGTGLLYYYIKNKNIKYTGIDKSSKLMQYFKNKFPKAYIKYSDVRKLSANDNEYDIVVCINVLMYVSKDIKNILKELLRVCKEKLFISIPITDKKTYMELHEGSHIVFNKKEFEKYITDFGGKIIEQKVVDKKRKYVLYEIEK